MGAKLLITARQTFDPVVDPIAVPHGAGSLIRRTCRELRPIACGRMLLDFYRDPLAWFGVFVSTLILAYAGGAVMFILHAVVLGEQGPAISPVAHWALDSTLGFVGLGPAVALIVPLAGWITTPGAGVAVRPGGFATVGGVLFALATAPGPIAHDLLVGRGTYLANKATVLLGGTVHAGHAAAGDSIPQALSIGLQVAVGVPTYVLLVWVALRAVRAVVRHRQQYARAREVLAG
jgi:hypothetical protein